MTCSRYCLLAIEGFARDRQEKQVPRWNSGLADGSSAEYWSYVRSFNRKHLPVISWGFDYPVRQKPDTGKNRHLVSLPRYSKKMVPGYKVR